MEKSLNNNKIQGSGFVKCTGIFDQRQVPYFDFEQQPPENDSLRCLLHPAKNEHGNTKAKNKQKN